MTGTSSGFFGWLFEMCVIMGSGSGVYECWRFYCLRSAAWEGFSNGTSVSALIVHSL